MAGLRYRLDWLETARSADAQQQKEGDMGSLFIALSRLHTEYDTQIHIFLLFLTMIRKL